MLHYIISITLHIKLPLLSTSHYTYNEYSMYSSVVVGYVYVLHLIIPIKALAHPLMYITLHLSLSLSRDGTGPLG